MRQKEMEREGTKLLVVCVLFAFILYYIMKFRNEIKWFCQAKMVGWFKWMRNSNALQCVCLWRMERANDNETKETRAKRAVQTEIINLKHEHTLTPSSSQPNMLIKYFSALTEIGRKHRHDERRNKSKQFVFYLYHSVSHFDARTHTQPQQCANRDLDLQMKSKSVQFTWTAA